MLFLESSHVRSVRAAYNSFGKHVPIWKTAAKFVRLPKVRSEFLARIKLRSTLMLWVSKMPQFNTYLQGCTFQVNPGTRFPI